MLIVEDDEQSSLSDIEDIPMVVQIFQYLNDGLSFVELQKQIRDYEGFRQV